MRTGTREEGRPHRKWRPPRKTRRARCPSTAQDPSPDADMHIPATVLHIIRLMTPRLPSCRRGMRPSWSEITLSRYPHPAYRGFLYMKPLFPGRFRTSGGQARRSSRIHVFYRPSAIPTRRGFVPPSPRCTVYQPTFSPAGGLPIRATQKGPIIAGTMGPCFAFAAELCERRLTWRSSRGRQPSCGRSH